MRNRCVDSSEEKLGTEGIDRSRTSGIDGSDDRRTLLGDCMRIVSTDDCRVVVEVEDCKVGGSHMELF